MSQERVFTASARLRFYVEQRKRNRRTVIRRVERQDDAK